MDPVSAKRREKWGWLPVLFLKAKERLESPGAANAPETLDADGQTLLRLVAHMLPRCVPAGAHEQRELEEISDRLEVLAGGLPEKEWADSLAGELLAGRGAGSARPSIRVSWG